MEHISQRGGCPHYLIWLLSSLLSLPVMAQQQTSSVGQSSANAPTQETTLENLTVTGVHESASLRLPLTARETPQSVSVTTRQRMDEHALTNVDSVMRQTTGVMTALYDTQRPVYYSRGFQINDFQVDGVPTYSEETNQEYDTALYERIDLIRGANGILTSTGAPSATVNLIRKHPARTLGGTVDLSAGQWDYYRAVADLNLPITADGSVRSRFVLAPQKKHSFYKRYEESKLAFLGVVEADLGSSTNLYAGYQRQKNAPKAPIWGAIPRFNTDGSLADLDISTSFSPGWTRWERTTGTAFLTLSHQLDDNWSVKANLDHTSGETHSLITYGYGATEADAPFINKLTGQNVTLYAYPGKTRETRNRLDVSLSGKLQLGGHQHDLIIGLNADRSISKSPTFERTNWRYDIPNIYTWDGSAPTPNVSQTGERNDTVIQQSSLYASARWHLTKPLALLTGARLTHWRSSIRSYDASGALSKTSAQQEIKHQVSPYLGLVYDLTPSLSTKYPILNNHSSSKTCWLFQEKCNWVVSSLTAQELFH